MGVVASAAHRALAREASPKKSLKDVVNAQAGEEAASGQHAIKNRFVVIALAALTTMVSTTLTTLDASPRVMAHTSKLDDTNAAIDYLLSLARRF